MSGMLESAGQGRAGQGWAMINTSHKSKSWNAVWRRPPTSMWK
jgi:hypothetical protein